MTLVAHLYDRLGQEEALYPLDAEEWDGTQYYLWVDGGNFSCDCNRGLFFSRALGREDEDVACGMIRFALKVCKDGITIYEEEI